MKRILTILIWFALPFLWFQCDSPSSLPIDPFSGNDTIVPIDTSDIPLPTDTIVEPVITDSSAVYVFWSETAFTTLDDGAYYSENANVRILNPYPDQIAVSVENADVSIVSTVPDIHFSLQGEHTQASFSLKSSHSVTVILNGLQLSHDRAASVLNLDSEKDCLLYLSNGSSNGLSDLSALHDSTHACLYSQAPLSLAGSGRLSLRSLHHHGIGCAQGFHIRESLSAGDSLHCQIQAGKDAIHCHHYFYMEGGQLITESFDDGIQCEMGSILLSGGDIRLTTTGDKSRNLTCDGSVKIQDGKMKLEVLGDASKGMKAGGDIIIEGGDIHIACSGHSIYDETDIDLSSSAGIKGNGQLYITGDSTRLHIVSSGIGGKGINIDGNIYIENGEIGVSTQGKRYFYNESLYTSPKAIKCLNLCINNGTFDVSTSGGDGADGIDCQRAFILYDGLCHIKASDDAVKAGTTINIHGGSLYAQSVQNDGLDALSGIQILGGKVFSAGSDKDKKGGFETEGVLLISGGEVMAVGNKNIKPDSRGGQYCICLKDSHSFKAGETLSLFKEGETEALLQGILPQEYAKQLHAVFSSPAVSKGNRYNIYRGNNILKTADVVSPITDLK